MKKTRKRKKFKNGRMKKMGHGFLSVEGTKKVVFRGQVAEIGKDEG